MTKFVKLFQGDCLEVLKQLSSESVDLVLTDPPYNIGKDFDNENLKEKEFKSFHSSYLKELKRVIKPQKPILIFFNTGENLSDFFNIASGILKFKKLLTLYKPNDCSFPLASVLRKSEALLLFTSGGTLNYKHETNVHDVLIANHTKKEMFYHPSVKNLKIIRKLVKAFSVEDGVVLDCFLGSGTTAVACKQTGRKCIGIEINEEYIKLSKKRLEQETLVTLNDYGGDNDD